MMQRYIALVHKSGKNQYGHQLLAQSEIKSFSREEVSANSACIPQALFWLDVLCVLVRVRNARSFRKACMGIKIDLLSIPVPDAGWSFDVTPTGDPVFCMACGGEVATDLQGNPLCMHGPLYIMSYPDFSSVSATETLGAEPTFTIFCEPCGCDVPADGDDNPLCEH